MADDFRLLFDTITVERPSRSYAVTVPAPWVPPKRQIETSIALRLPYMRHLVQEKSLQGSFGIGKIVAIVRRFRVEVDMPAWGHRDFPRL